MKKLFKRPADQRRGVVICGAYGMDNAGDDAVLAAMVRALRRLDGDMPITVICRHGKKTARRFGVHTAGRLALPALLPALGRAKLFLLGGGSLLQDATSRRSLEYYLSLLRLAKTMGCAVQLYGAGAGPIHSSSARRRTAEALELYADAVTVRDGLSLQTLQSWGVTKPRLLLAADPALSAAAPAGERERCAGFALRPWPEFWERAEDFAAAARYAWERYHLKPVFFCLAPEDRRAVKVVTELLPDVPYSVSADSRRLGRMALVVGMRLHALVFALNAAAPAAGVSYDPKVDGFCREAGLPMTALEDASEGALVELIDFALALDGEHLSASLNTLRARERVNLEVAASLLAGG